MTLAIGYEKVYWFNHAGSLFAKVTLEYGYNLLTASLFRHL